MTRVFYLLKMASDQAPHGSLTSGLSLLLYLAACISPCFLAAQSDSAQVLLGVTIRDASLEKTGFSSWPADSLPVSGILTLSERIAFENPLAARPNAPGTLATLSARGLGPSHTPVFWQGFNLQSPQNGVVDASLVPIWQGDQVEVRYGGQSAVLSSGALGAAVMVESAPELRESEGFFGSLSGAAGSFGRLETAAALGWKGEKTSALTRAAFLQADNDFPFENFALIGSPKARQQNNFLKKLDVQHFSRWAVNDKNVVRLSAWQQTAFRELPPAMTEAPRKTWQRDRAFRAVAGWESNPGPHSRWVHQAAWFDEAINFHLAGDTDSSRARTASFSSNYTFSPYPKWLLKGGATGTLQWGRADGYADTARWFRQERLALYGMAERAFSNGRLSVLLRQEWADQGAAPFTWSLGGAFGPARFHVSHNFLLPTFNDRFWRAWGNPDLLPESGYSADVGLEFRKKISAQQTFSAEPTVFNALTDNWILWQPGADGIFRPSNARRVWSRGTELALDFEQQWTTGWRMWIKARWQYTLTTNTAVYAGETGVLHKQLPYVPKQGAACSFWLTKGPFSGAYLHQWTGVRFTSSDNAEKTPAFNTGTLLVRYEWRMAQKAPLALDFRLENCWNSPYQVIAYRPMPGRNWRLGIQWVF